MSVHLVTFSDKNMERSAKLCMDSATRHGVDYVGYWPHDAPVNHSRRQRVKGLRQTTFYKQNEPLLSQPRGLGFWAWKPYIIQKLLNNCADGEIAIYSDVGVEFIAPVSHIIDRMGHDRPQDDVWLFGNNWEHAHWCKRDVVDEIWRDYEAVHNDPVCRDEQGRLSWAHFSKQVQASVIFFRVSDYTRKFVAEWLHWCLFEGGRLIDDSPSRLPNHPEFQEHRHDQSILTTLSYREGLKLHWWPAVYNRGGSPEFVYEKLPEYASDDYPILVHHHRRRDHEWK